MDERYLTPKARRRREIVADIETALAYLAGILTAVACGMVLRMMGVM